MEGRREKYFTHPQSGVGEKRGRSFFHIYISFTTVAELNLPLEPVPSPHPGRASPFDPFTIPDTGPSTSTWGSLPLKKLVL